MAAWETAAAADPGSDPAAWAWHLHNWLVCIHPFPDGNGRVGRLVLNQARRDAGLEWLSIAAEEGLDYAARIRSWRDCEGAHLMRQPNGGPCQ
jgi:fido (protein-threonine AMPylation protein)